MQPDPPAPPTPRAWPSTAPPPALPPEPLPPEEPPPERELWPWLLALAVVVIGAIVAGIVVATHHHHKKRTVTVSRGPPKLTAPNVVGLPIATAAKRLQAAGLESTQRVVYAAAPPGRVVKQRPTAGTAVKKGAAVVLVVSRGPRRISVPNVVGRSRDDAIARIKKAGLVPAIFSVPSQEPHGFVVAQSPRAGTNARKGSRVRLNVSQGAPAATTTAAATAPAPTTTGAAATANVPNVVGQSQVAAQRRLHAAGFRVRTVYVASTQPQGTVVAQHPAPGTSLSRDSRVRINVSNGPNAKPAQAVPDVSGEDEATARSDLQAAGFRVTVVDEPTTDQNEDGIVLDQDPTGGTQAPTGSVVTIYVGRFG